ncbi:Nif3-like dinuclear metal center hexameric protein [Psychrobacter sp. FDAARGOS_221]|uniref:Nif3-like dinuclear metal center hexameric protein n=1 Tax=Psychrobacter sp. FDAARGOS_221 TaxID=1975705 RepID=UPI000BB57F76|nr:Nif3-like dinuclear metal center hexameric protein [Psychrobacter sp. FDAARGOS_221]PNK59905.1 Nif3-like dinuclear metal center hexameric protein [Psychrobacter sp. FDAARGOS_221]
MNHTQISPTALAQWCDTYLQASEFSDYCPNGLQVDTDTPIENIITGVTASQNLIDAAIEANADAILVHHGYFWKGEPSPLTGMKGKRIRSLMQNNISLLAYHLPLDAHPIIGNNAILAEQLDLEITGALYPHEKHPVGNIAKCDPITIQDFITKVSDKLQRIPTHISAGNDVITRVGICTGGAQDMIEQAAAMDCQLYISGEISERTTHAARELGIDYLACGHHATEKGGIQALGDLIEQSLGLSVRFIDDPNPA